MCNIPLSVNDAPTTYTSSEPYCLRDTMYYSSLDIQKPLPRKLIVKSRKRHRAAILADTRNKNELEAEQKKPNARNNNLVK